MSGSALTEQDFERLRELAESDARVARDGWGPAPDEPWVECHRCGYEWTYTGSRARADCPRCRARPVVDGHEDGRGLTLAMCNAIRCAAEDGNSYRAIARLFGFISSAETARLHAIGECVHEAVDYPPVARDRDSGFGHQKLSAGRCRLLRRRYRRGEFETYAEAGEAVDVHRTTAATHIKGECKHGAGDGS